MYMYFLCLFLVEPPEVIDSRDLEYPDRQYRVDNLEMPEPILSSDGSKMKFSKGDSSPDGLLKTSPDKSSKLHNIILLSSLRAPSPFHILPLSLSCLSHSTSLSLSLSLPPFSLSLLSPTTAVSYLTSLSFSPSSLFSCSLHSW